ncbi:MAG: alanine racemase [Acidobacteriota bacterium]|nr:alanine racemase [Acidobacteriota bacterium]
MAAGFLLKPRRRSGKIAVMTDIGVDRQRLRTWIELDRDAIAHNLRVLRGLLPDGCRLMAVAKSNAYGHGLYDFVPAVDQLGADWLGVDSIVEAATLREIGIEKPILVLGYTLPARFEEAARNRIVLTVSSFENLEALGRSGYAERIRVHIKIDTGLHRQGFLPDQVGELLSVLRRDHPGLVVDGLYTHFAEAKDPDDTGYTQRQIAAFQAAAAAFRESGFRPMLHACGTGGMLLHPEAHLDMVRTGIGLFGQWPSRKIRAALENRTPLHPVLSWRTILSEIKTLPAGSGISYKLTETLEKDSVVGVCPIGYWHGFPRALSRRGEVLVRGQRARVLGAVTMDMIVVDLTGIPAVRAGDTVTVIGRDGADEVAAGELAERAGQSLYEFLTRLNPLIRKYVLPVT